MASRWHGRGTRHERGYGAAWVKLREVILRRDGYLCKECARQGFVRAGSHVDHIKPKYAGGTDDHDNLQTLCAPCHDEKTKAEAAEAQQELRDQGKSYFGADGWPVIPKRWGYSIPHGLQPAQRSTHVVFGPPASGKTTYVKDRARPADKVIDLDDIKERLGGSRYTTDRKIVAQSLRWRDMAIRGLCRPNGGTAWLILTGKTRAERAAWMEALGPMATEVLLSTDRTTCRDRVDADPSRAPVAADLHTVIAEFEY